MHQIIFFHPPWGGIPSGGNKFNRRMLAFARGERFPLRSCPVAANPAFGTEHLHAELTAGSLKPVRSARLHLWDSLLMAQYVHLPAPAHRRDDAFLMHYLPSMNPCLTESARADARLLEDRVADRIRFFIATGQGLADVLRRRYPRVDAYVCEPGVDAIFSKNARRAGASRNATTVRLLSVGNLLPSKGQRELLAVLLTLAQSSWCWHIVGSPHADREFVQEFSAQAEPLLASGRLIFHGDLAPRALARLMSGMDVFVSASHFESYGIALAEAAAVGLPAVTTDVGEAREILANRLDSRLIPVGAWDLYVVRLNEVLDGILRGRFPAIGTSSAVARSWAEAFADFAAALTAGIGNLP